VDAPVTSAAGLELFMVAPSSSLVLRVAQKNLGGERTKWSVGV